MLRSLAKIAVGYGMLIAFAYGQITPEPAASAVVSPSNSLNESTPKESNATPSPSIEIEPGQPADSTADASIVVDPLSLLPDPKPIPTSKATLTGGTIGKLDRVRDEIMLDVFGGGRQKILFDPRTRIYVGQKETSAIDLKEGERVYVDTVLDGDTVFARSIRLRSTSAMAESQAVVVKYRPERGELTLRDSLSPSSIRVRMTPSTRLVQGNRVVSASSLSTGCLVSVKFSPEGNGREVAREISILAQPGVRYTFVGQVVHLDLRSGLIVLNSSTDHKTYEIYLDPSRTPDENLQLGATVTVVTNLDGWRYMARTISIEPQNK